MKLGTRKSLLAWAQSSWVARELERLNPGVKVELVGIETRGDRILDIPLQAVAGKEFFVAEIDDALRGRAVDLTVHSMKDLSLDRPAEFVLAANPRRENPRDVVLFGPSAEEALRAGRPVRVGTSSPRRLENIPSFLRSALPRLGSGEPSVELVEIRGNVNTRLSRVHEQGERHLDGVVLAFAGLIRLWVDEKGRTELQRLFQGVRWMILPVQENPAAPAQGALAIECRKDDARTREVVGRLHDPATAAQVSSERQLLADWGGGCHQKFGATAITHGDLGELLYIRGRKPDGEFVEELRWRGGAGTASKPVPWDGSEWRAEGASEELEVSPLSGDAFFVAHWRACTTRVADQLRALKPRIWVSGSSSWFKLAALGLWVEGSAEGFGFEMVAPALAEPVLRHPPQSSWTVLTHEDASGWSSQRVVTPYRVKGSYSEEARATAKEATHLFWSSGSQFEALGKLAQASAVHSCGPGKTAQKLRELGLNPKIFPSRDEWKRWLKS